MRVVRNSAMRVVHNSANVFSLGFSGARRFRRSVYYHLSVVSYIVRVKVEVYSLKICLNRLTVRVECLNSTICWWISHPRRQNTWCFSQLALSYNTAITKLPPSLGLVNHQVMLVLKLEGLFIKNVPAHMLEKSRAKPILSYLKSLYQK